MTGMTGSAILKLGDFGVSKYVLYCNILLKLCLPGIIDIAVHARSLFIPRLLETSVSLASTVAGTPYSLAPELCNSQPYSYSCDVWALGILFYELLTTRHAFDGPR